MHERAHARRLETAGREKDREKGHRRLQNATLERRRRAKTMETTLVPNLQPRPGEEVTETSQSAAECEEPVNRVEEEAGEGDGEGIVDGEGDGGRAEGRDVDGAGGERAEMEWAWEQEGTEEAALLRLAGRPALGFEVELPLGRERESEGRSEEGRGAKRRRRSWSCMPEQSTPAQEQAGGSVQAQGRGAVPQEARPHFP
eukprot:1463230-Rhodomonas_salina.1